MKLLTTLALGAMTACSLLLGACSSDTGALDDQIQLVAGTAESNGVAPSTGDFATPSGGPPPQPGPAVQMAERWVALKRGEASGVGQVVVNGRGLTLYRFDRDSNDPPTSNCSGQCAQKWPKLLVGQSSKLFVGQGIDNNDIGSIPAGNGTYQITLGGWPVYRFADDSGAGRAKGQGVQGTWFAIAPNGEKANGGNNDNHNNSSDNVGSNSDNSDKSGDDYGNSSNGGDNGGKGSGAGSSGTGARSNNGHHQGNS